MTGTSESLEQTAQVAAGYTPPTPDLRIVPVSSLHPHEDHDSQRALPLIERLRNATVFTNPLIAASIPGSSGFVILDGSNRHYSFASLGYPHTLIQVVDYGTPWIELGVWNHVITGLSVEALLLLIGGLEAITVDADGANRPIATIVQPDGTALSLMANTADLRKRRALLREVVHLYQQQGVLNRTAQSDPNAAFSDFPDAAFMVLFAPFVPSEIIEAAATGAFLPPGISRHIVHGRAVRLDYPMAALIDPHQSLDAKNATLRGWLHRKFAHRAVRYYAESTYHFDE